MTHFFRRGGLVTAALAVALTVTGCISTPGGSTTTDPNAIKIGTLRGQPHLFTPFFMEQFAPEGTSYEVVVFDSSPDIKNAIVSGAIDFASVGVPSVLAGVAAGEDLRIVASEANGGYGFVGDTDIETTDDLRGRSIGYPAGATQEILLKLILQAHGIDPRNDVQLVNLPFSDMANAYQSGQIDAFLGAEVGPSIALENGAHPLTSPYETPIGGVNIAFATRNSLIDEDPEKVRTVVESLAKATDYMEANPDEWASEVVAEFGLDPDVTNRAITNIDPRWELDPQYIEQATALAQQMVDFDQISASPDMTKVFDTSFVEGVGNE